MYGIIAGRNGKVQSWEKHFPGPMRCVGALDIVVRFIGIEMEGLPQVPGVSSPSVPPWAKSSLAFIRPRNRASVQKFCAMPKLSPVQLLSLSR